MLAPLTSRPATLPAVTFEALPDDLPGEGTVSAEAQGLTDHAAGVRAAYDDAASSWSGLSDGRLDVPDGEVVRTALQDTVLPHVEDHEEVTGAVRGALDTFDADIAELAPVIRQAITDGETLNSTPPADRDEDFHRRAQLQQEHVLALGARYDEIVQTCVDAINSAGGHRRPNEVVGAAARWLQRGSDAWGTTATASAMQLAQPNWKNGRLVAGFDSSRFTAKSGHKYRPPKLPRSLYRMAGVPEDYLQKFDAAAAGNGDRVSNTDTQRMLKSVDGAKTPLGKLVGAVPSLKNSKLSFDGQDLQIEAALSPGDGVPSSSSGTKPTGLKKAAEAIETVGSSPWVKGLGLAGTALSAQGNYTEAYNQSLARDPQAPEGEHRKSAAFDTAFKTGTEAAGGALGTGIGTSLGATAGQVIIPIPGVGAAIGGVLGGALGGALGSHLGGAIGDGINAIRHADGDMFDVAAEGVQATLDAINPFT